MIGRSAERRAVSFLKKSGLKIVARNLRAGGGEIDILAREGECVVVVEVRQRASGILAADLSVGMDKERLIRRCWAALRRRYRIPRSVAVRFDLVLVGDRGVEHLRGVI